MNINYEKLFAPYSPTDTHITIPKKFFSELFNKMQCNISHQFINTGVLCDDGILYEDESITNWLTNNKKSPITGQIIKKKIQCHTFKSIKNLIIEYFNYEDLDMYMSEKYMVYENNYAIIDALLANHENKDTIKLAKYNNFDIHMLAEKGLTYNVFQLPLNLFNHILNNLSTVKNTENINNKGWLDAIRYYDKKSWDYYPKTEKLVRLNYITREDLYNYKNNIEFITSIFKKLTKDNISTFGEIIMTFNNYDICFLLKQFSKNINLLDIFTLKIVLHFTSNSSWFCEDKIDYEEYYIVVNYLRKKIAPIPNDIYSKKYLTEYNKNIDVNDNIIKEYCKIFKLFELFYIPAFVAESKFKNISKNRIKEEYDYMLYFINNKKTNMYIKCFDDLFWHTVQNIGSLSPTQVSISVSYKLIDLIDKSDLTIFEKNKIHRKILKQQSWHFGYLEETTDKSKIIDYYFSKFTFERIFEITKNGDLFKNSLICYLLLLNLKCKIKISDQETLNASYDIIVTIIKKYCDMIHSRTAEVNANFYNQSGMLNTCDIKGALVDEINVILEISETCKYQFEPSIWSLLFTYSYNLCGDDGRMQTIIDHLIKIKYPNIIEIIDNLPYCKNTISNICIQSNIVSSFLNILNSKKNKIANWDNEYKKYLEKIIKEVYEHCLSKYIQHFRTYPSNKILFKKPKCKGLFVCPCDNALLNYLKAMNE